MCHFGVVDCTAAEHPGTDSTMYARCPTHSETTGRDGARTGPVVQHYNRKTGHYECWHCALDRFHARQPSGGPSNAA